MPAFAVSYDLVEKRNYPSLYRLLKAYNTSIPITESTWCIVANETSVQIRDYLQQALDSDDQLIVFKLTGEWAATSTLNVQADWLRAHVGAKP